MPETAPDLKSIKELLMVKAFCKITCLNLTSRGIKEHDI